MSGGLPVRCRGVVHIYAGIDGDDVVALRGLDLDVAPSESIALLGPSGCGKSTLLSLMSGLLRPSAGRIEVGTHNIGRLSHRELVDFRSGRVGTVLQGAARNLLLYGTAEDNVAFAQSTRSRRMKAGTTSPRAVLATLGLERAAETPVGRLSGGEQQRVAIAVAIANSPGLLVADEPTSQLDHRTRDEVLAALALVRERLGTTVVLVTHDPAVGATVDRTVVMRDGRVGAEGRLGEQDAVVSSDGAVHLPEEVMDEWAPGTRVRVDIDPQDRHLHIRRADQPADPEARRRP